MSKLRLTDNHADWQMNVLAFNSPVYTEISSAQTKTMAMHFPIRCTQPEIQFSVVFTSENEFENFQRYVRAHQKQVSQDATNLITMNWPERNINNWTGVIKSFQAGGKRFNFAPQASFSMTLVDSMVSKRTNLYVDPGGILWKTIYGEGMGKNSVLSAPTNALNQFDRNFYGEDTNGNVATPVPGINVATSSASAPGIGAAASGSTAGIVTGS